MICVYVRIDWVHARIDMYVYRERKREREREREIVIYNELMGHVMYMRVCMICVYVRIDWAHARIDTYVYI